MVIFLAKQKAMDFTACAWLWLLLLMFHKRSKACCIPRKLNNFSTHGIFSNN